MSDDRLDRICGTLSDLSGQFEQQLSQHRMESNRQQSLISDLSRRLKVAEEALHQQQLIFGLAMVIDRLDAYYGADPDTAASVRDELLELLALHDVHPVACQGPFDPRRQEVIRVEHRPDAAPREVLAVWSRGYVRGDRLLRPAKVVINHIEPSTDTTAGTAADHPNPT